MHGTPVRILVRKANNEIIAGHTRIKALKQIGEQLAPVIFLDLSETDAHVYNIFDNKSVENVEWDMSLLAEHMIIFNELDVDLKLTGFDDDEINMFDVKPTKEGMQDIPTEPDFQQMVFTVHNEQVGIIKEALQKAKAEGSDTDINANSNGNALAYISDRFMNA